MICYQECQAIISCKLSSVARVGDVVARNATESNSAEEYESFIFSLFDDTSTASVERSDTQSHKIDEFTVHECNRAYI